MSDDQLYRQYLSGDAAAGNALMLRYADALTAYLDLSWYYFPLPASSPHLSSGGV